MFRMQGEEALPLVVILGPTAVGKTAVAIQAARAMGAEIISADSMQVYRGMDIGTAKPTLEERAQARFHLIDVADPDEPFSAARFSQMAGSALSEIMARGQRVIMAGGTGLYLRAFLSGFTLAPKVDAYLRAQLIQESQTLGLTALHQRLSALDPIAAERIHANDSVRIIRALEVIMTTGKPISEQQAQTGKPVRAQKFGLTLPRESLYERIEQRVDSMMVQGFLQEVEALQAKGYHAGLPSMKSLGYRHLMAYLQGEWSLESAVHYLKRDTKRFAKRQMTWFRREEDVQWLDVNEGLDSAAERVVHSMNRGNHWES